VTSALRAVEAPAPAPAHPDSLLPVVLEDVGYTLRGRALLAGVSLTIPAGSRSLLLGPNGAGKTLLLRLLHGLVAPTTGRILWGGDPRRVRAAQAMVFQRVPLLRRSVAANVRYALAARGVPRARRRAICGEVLERTGLAALARRPARALSGGEQRRVAIARAWAVAPEVLLLDEPTANLDPAAVRVVEALIGSIHASGTKVVMATHDLAQARRLADDVAFLHRGRCLEHSGAGRFFGAPASPEARAFLAGELLA
jgi:tungstate transport system ATP-binding protein